MIIQVKYEQKTKIMSKLQWIENAKGWKYEQLKWQRNEIPWRIINKYPNNSSSFSADNAFFVQNAFK